MPLMKSPLEIFTCEFSLNRHLIGGMTAKQMGDGQTQVVIALAQHEQEEMLRLL
jgi:hypothetical protein